MPGVKTTTRSHSLTPDARKVLRNLGSHGPADLDGMALLFGVHPAKFDGRRQESRDWADVRVRAQMALSELEETGRIIRLRTRRDALFMLPGDVPELVEEALQVLGQRKAGSPAPILNS